MRNKHDRLVMMTIVLVVVTLLYLLLQIGRWASRTDKPVQKDPPSSLESLAVAMPTLPVAIEETTTTTTAPPPTTTTEVSHTTTSRASRGAQRTEVKDGDFWRRLANCESSTGRGGNGGGYFQFSPDTAAKVGVDGSESYEDQRDAAISWAALIHPNEGSTSGWPHCWWVALAG